MKDDIGDRMKKNYENRTRFHLTRRTPVIIRLDGRSFHTLCRHMERPFDKDFIDAMAFTGKKLLEEIQGAKVAFIQSDEISLLLTDYDKLTTDAWFDYNIQKMCSISASLASVTFSEKIKRTATFDSRAFNIPREEVTNYFIWRQRDWMRNSLSMLCQSHFSHKELIGKSRIEQHEMLHGIGVNWVELESRLKNGTILLKKENVVTEIYTDIQEHRNLIEAMVGDTDD